MGKIDLSEFDTCKNESSAFDESKMDQLYDIFYKIKSDEKMCPKSCNIRRYIGEVVLSQNRPGNIDNHTFVTYFEFDPPYRVKVREEYLIYDFIGLVGSVGGTLGLFIGFSFYDIISRLYNKLRNL